MKLVIDIPEEMHERIKDGYVPLGISKYLKNGTPYEERPHGEWILNEDGHYECSRCGIAWKDMPAKDTKPVFKACPWCGADMRVKNELNRVSKELNSEIEKSKSETQNLNSEIVPDYRDGCKLKGSDNE